MSSSAAAVREVGLQVPSSRIVTSLDELGGVSLPAVIRPAFTLGGHGGGFVETVDQLYRQVERGLGESPIGQVLVEESVRGWDEFELEVVRDSKDNVVIVCSIENIDPMGVHTGDSVTVAPQMTLSDTRIRSCATPRPPWCVRSASSAAARTSSSRASATPESCG